MSMLRELLETEESQNFLYENQNLIMEHANEVVEFSEILKEFVVQNPNYFLEPTLENTYKNIRMFSEIATAQYLSEVVNMSVQNMRIQNESVYDPLNDYL